MADLFSLAVHSMNSDLRVMNISAENASNVNTMGYKRRIPITTPVYFEQVMDNVALSKSVAPYVKTDTSIGAAIKTGNPLDLMIEGDGWLEVTNNGRVAYTRAGELTLDPSGYLVTQEGWMVNSDGGAIRLGTVEPKIVPNGDVFDGESNAGRLKLVRIAGEVAPVGGGLFATANGADVHELRDESDIRVRQGFVEKSNTNPMGEMLGLIETVRHFELMQRFVSAYDGMLDTTISKLGQV